MLELRLMVITLKSQRVSLGPYKPVITATFEHGIWL
jgi:hypothetical protein